MNECEVCLLAVWHVWLFIKKKKKKALLKQHDKKKKKKSIKKESGVELLQVDWRGIAFDFCTHTQKKHLCHIHLVKTFLAGHDFHI